MELLDKKQTSVLSQETNIADTKRISNPVLSETKLENSAKLKPAMSQSYVKSDVAKVFAPHSTSFIVILI
jgi:hypothetical protein